MSVRQRAFAHVYVGEPINGEVWHRDLLFAVETDLGWRPAAASHRIQFAVITNRFHAHANRLTAIMNEHPLPEELYRKHEFDPVKIFGTKEAVNAVLAGQTEGRASFVGR